MPSYLEAYAAAVSRLMDICQIRGWRKAINTGVEGFLACLGTLYFQKGLQMLQSASNRERAMKTRCWTFACQKLKFRVHPCRTPFS